MTCIINGADAWVTVSPASHPLILQTAFLHWDAAAANVAGARVRLQTWQMIKAFGARFSSSRAPPDIPATESINPLILAMTGAFWARALNEYVASGLLNVAAQCREELAAGIAALAIATPANLIIGAND